jgi:hypothetical protein
MLPTGQPGIVLVKNNTKKVTMKNIKLYSTVIALVLSWMASAQSNNDSMKKAIEKAKSDLLEIIEVSGKDFDFGISAEQLRSSQAQSTIVCQNADFDKLVTMVVDSLNNSINPILSKSERMLVPFVNQNKVVATIMLVANEKGEITAGELLNQQYVAELNALPAEIKQKGFAGLSLITVPNLRATIYYVDGNMYTSYNGRSLRQPQDPTMFLQSLVVDAKRIQEQYGSLLKERKLLD